MWSIFSQVWLLLAQHIKGLKRRVFSLILNIQKRKKCGSVIFDFLFLWQWKKEKGEEQQGIHVSQDSDQTNKETDKAIQFTTENNRATELTQRLLYFVSASPTNTNNGDPSELTITPQDPCAQLLHQGFQLPQLFSALAFWTTCLIVLVLFLVSPG